MDYTNITESESFYDNLEKMSTSELLQKINNETHTSNTNTLTYFIIMRNWVWQPNG